MKRYIHAAAQDIHPKRKSYRQRLADKAEAASQLFAEAASIASDMLGREIVVESVRDLRDHAWVGWSMPDAYNAEPQHYIFELKKTSKQVAADLVEWINGLRAKGKLFYKDEADAVYAQVHDLLIRISEIASALGQEYDSDITIDAERIEKDLRMLPGAAARIAVSGSYIGDCKIVDEGYGLYRGYRISLPQVMAWVSLRDLLNRGPEYIENEAKRALTDYFQTVEQSMNEIDVVVDNGDRFESDVENFCDDFTRAYIGRYPGLEVTYSIEIPSETERIYKPMVLRAILEVHCYNDEIAFRMEFTYDEWHQTDITKKIVNAIKYRKRRDGI